MRGLTGKICSKSILITELNFILKLYQRHAFKLLGKLYCFTFFNEFIGKSNEFSLFSACLHRQIPKEVKHDNSTEIYSTQVPKCDLIKANK